MRWRERERAKQTETIEKLKQKKNVDEWQKPCVNEGGSHNMDT